MLDQLPNITGLPFDVRAEVLAMLIAERFGLSVEQLLYNPACWHQRPGRSDVADLTEGFSHRLEKKLLYIDTSRESLFDMLPEAIFLHPEEQFGSNLRKVQALSEQEAKARQFLLPFEQLFFWMRLENEISAWQLEENLLDWWSSHFPSRETDKLEGRQRTVLLDMLPYAQEIIGNWALTAQWMSLFSGHQVRIEEETFPTYQLPESLQKRLGEAVLGQDSVLGTSFADGIPAIRIVVEDLAPNELAGLLPGAAERDFLEENFVQFLLPVETPFSIELIPKTTESPFELAEGNETNILGYTLHI